MDDGSGEMGEGTDGRHGGLLLRFSGRDHRGLDGDHEAAMVAAPGPQPSGGRFCFAMQSRARPAAGKSRFSPLRTSDRDAVDPSARSGHPRRRRRARERTRGRRGDLRIKPNGDSSTEAVETCSIGSKAIKTSTGMESAPVCCSDVVRKVTTPGMALSQWCEYVSASSASTQPPGRSQ